MGRKRKKHKALIFCYYCDKEYSNEKTLIQHQRAKHFKCLHCGRKLGTAKSMQAHSVQIHHKAVSVVPSSIKGRDSFNHEVFGMDGVPADVIQAKMFEETGLYPQLEKRARELSNKAFGSSKSRASFLATPQCQNPDSPKTPSLFQNTSDKTSSKTAETPKAALSATKNGVGSPPAAFAHPNALVGQDQFHGQLFASDSGLPVGSTATPFSQLSRPFASHAHPQWMGDFKVQAQPEDFGTAGFASSFAQGGEGYAAAGYGAGGSWEGGQQTVNVFDNQLESMEEIRAQSLKYFYDSENEDVEDQIQSVKRSINKTLDMMSTGVGVVDDE